MKNNKTRRTALCALLCALCVVILFVGSVIEVLDISVAAIGSMIITLVVLEISAGAAFMVYLGATILSLLLLPNKFGAVVFALFCGFYPILKRYFEANYKGVFCWIFKFITLNISLAVILYASLYIIGINTSEIPLIPLMIILCNIAFLLYDIALTRLITYYVYKLRHRFKFFK